MELTLSLFTVKTVLTFVTSETIAGTEVWDIASVCANNQQYGCV